MPQNKQWKIERIIPIASQIVGIISILAGLYFTYKTLDTKISNDKKFNDEILSKIIDDYNKRIQTLEIRCVELEKNDVSLLYKVLQPKTITAAKPCTVENDWKDKLPFLNKNLNDYKQEVISQKETIK